MDNFTIYIAIPVMFLAIVFLFFCVVYKNSQAKMYKRKWQEVRDNYIDMREHNRLKANREVAYRKSSLEWQNERSAKAEAKGYKHNHLMSGIENNKGNRDIVASINKEMKKSKSKYRLIIKYRKPKQGYSDYGFTSHVRQEDALLFSVYLRNKVYEN